MRVRESVQPHHSNVANICVCVCMYVYIHTYMHAHRCNPFVWNIPTINTLLNIHAHAHTQPHIHAICYI